jgi:thymidylate kinase
MRKKYSICLEGPTAAGKTTVALYLTQELRKKGFDVRYVKLSPSHNLIGRMVRRILATFRLYPLEDIGYLLDNFVELFGDTFSNHEITIYDKSPYNIVAFWKTLRNNRYTSFLEGLAQYLYSSFQPDMTFYLTAEYEERRRRVRNKKSTSEMDEVLIQPHVDKEITKYLYHYSRAYNKNLECIDTTRRSVEEVGMYILNRIISLIKK